MTKLLEQALGAVSALSPEEQDEIARMMLAMSGEQAPETIDPAHLSAVLEGLDQARRGEFASDEEVAAAFRRFER
jgi:predicted transcriptional regulator